MSIFRCNILSNSPQKWFKTVQYNYKYCHGNCDLFVLLLFTGVRCEMVLDILMWQSFGNCYRLWVPAKFIKQYYDKSVGCKAVNRLEWVMPTPDLIVINRAPILSKLKPGMQVLAPFSYRSHRTDFVYADTKIISISSGKVLTNYPSKSFNLSNTTRCI